MASTKVLFPNGGTHTGTVFPSGTVASVLSDNDSQTWVSHGSSGTALISHETYSLAADERCAGARAYWLGDAPNSFTASWGPELAGMDMSEQLPTIVPGGGSQTRERRTGWKQGPGANGEFSQANIDDLRVEIEWTALAGNVLLFRSREVRLELNVLKAPAATISAVTSSPNASGGADVTTNWAYSGNGEAQSRYRLKLFEASVYNDPAFDPDASPSARDTGWVNSSASSHTFQAMDYGTTYYSVLAVSKNFNNAPWDSSWTSGAVVTTTSRPVVTVTAPSGTVAESSPHISWTFSDADGGSQGRFHVAVYQRPGASWAGFNPDTASPLWSREFPGSLTTWHSAGPFGNGLTLRAYVKAAKGTYFGPLVWSEWAYSDFVTNFPQPPAPTIAATEQGDRVSVTVTPNSGGVVPDSFDVLRSADGGATWEFFRTGDGNTSENRNPGSKSQFTVVDHEPLLGKPMQYKARSMTTSSGFEVNSPDSNVATVTPSARVVWLKDPLDATRNRHFFVSDKWLTQTRKVERVVQHPLGREKPVVIRGEAGGISFQMGFTVLGEDQYEALSTLLRSNRTLLVQSTKGNWFVEVASDYQETPHLWDSLRGEQEDAWLFVVSFLEVDY